MGYDIRLVKDGKTVEVANHTEGSTYAMGGTTKAELAITYNYCDQYSLLEGFSGSLFCINDQKAEELIPFLKYAVAELGTERVDNYWESTPGNAGYALSILLKWCEQHPDAIVEVL